MPCFWNSAFVEKSVAQRPGTYSASRSSSSISLVVAVEIANITCGITQDDVANELDGQSHTMNNFDKNVNSALRDAVGGKEAAIGACRACRAAINKCSSRAADGARRSCR
eukprot:6153800-Pleurochrysis_carterae.AAC.3